MKKHKYLLLLLSILALKTPALNWQNATLPDSQESQIILENQHYRIQKKTIGAPPEKGYPVLYILDGNAFFPTIASIAPTHLKNHALKTNHSLLIIGIDCQCTNEARQKIRPKLYTPSEDSAPPAIHTLLKILPEQLDTPIDPTQQHLFGHSLSAYYALYHYTHSTSPYKSYHLISPSLWWNKSQLLKEIAPPLPQSQIHLYAGELEAPTPEDTRRIERNMLGNIETLKEKLQEAQIPHSYTLYPQEHHGSVPYRALLDIAKHLKTP